MVRYPTQFRRNLDDGSPDMLLLLLLIIIFIILLLIYFIFGDSLNLIIT